MRYILGHILCEIAHYLNRIAGNIPADSRKVR